MASADLIREASIEYRSRISHRQADVRDPVVRKAFERSIRLNGMAADLFEVHRHTIAAEVAMGCDDLDLMRDCISALVADVRRLTKAYNQLAQEGPK